MKTDSRFLGLDYLRGGGIALLVLLHAAIYSYSGYETLEMPKVPVYIMLLAFVGLWGGGFSMYSLAVNTARTIQRRAGKIYFKDIRYLIFAGALYLVVVATLQTLLFGRWDVFGQSPDYTLVPSLLRGLEPTLHFDKLMTGSGIKTVGLNLVVTPIVLYFVFRKKGLRDTKENYIFLLSIGTLILALSFLRILLYRDWIHARLSDDYVLSILGSLFVADPYPGIAYLSYGFFGAAIGMMLAYKRHDLIKSLLVPLACFFVLVGALGMLMQPFSFFSVGWFWYFKTVAETGIFLGMFIVAVKVSLAQSGRGYDGEPSRRSSWIVTFSRLSLTVYVLETFVSEFLRIVWDRIVPDWDGSMHLCVVFGVTNVVAWAAIAYAWKASNYRYSLEHLWVASFSVFGKSSSKID